MRPFAIALTLLCLSPATFAADAVVGNGNPASCIESTFDAALAIVQGDIDGGELSFNCGPDPDFILLSSVKNLANFVVIDGGGKMTLNGQDLTRLFNVNQDGDDGRTEVTIRNITLTRGNSGAQPFGGLVLVNANTRLDVDNVIMRNSLAPTSGGAIAAAPGTILNVTNSRFISNLSANGGAIATSALTTVTGSVFTNNNASGGEGGAIQSYAQNLTVRSSQFGGNGARLGGAIYKRDAEFDVFESNFGGNTASQNGGAIYSLATTTRARVSNSYLNGNSATLDGGAIFAEKYLVLFRSSLSGNTARKGGALRVDGGGAFIDSVTLDNNSATLEGGGVSVSPALNDSAMLINYLTTSNNTVTSANGFGGDMAFTASVPARLTIGNSTLMGGSAQSSASSIFVMGGAPGQIVFDISGTLTWARSGSACFYSNVNFSNSGGNVGAPSCALPELAFFNFADFNLGEFADYGGGHRTFLPAANSGAVDRNAARCGFVDARVKPSPINGDGINGAECDSGAVERQLIEGPGSLFRSGFEAPPVSGVSR
jgi:predicted outer membrane repeat protein